MAEIGKDIIMAKQLLENGNLVAIPTETVYGLAGNALDPTAVVKIFAVKDRPHFDPLIVHVSKLDQKNGAVQAGNASMPPDRFRTSKPCLCKIAQACPLRFPLRQNRK